MNLAGTSRTQTLSSSNPSFAQRRQSSGYVNKSLSAFANVMSALEEGAKYIPFRDSVLTQILRPAFLSGTNLSVIGMIEPSRNNQNETCDTLDFLTRIKKIKIGEEAYNIEYKKEMSLQQLNTQLREKDQKVKSLERQGKWISENLLSSS